LKRIPSGRGARRRWPKLETSHRPTYSHTLGWTVSLLSTQRRFGWFYERLLPDPELKQHLRTMPIAVLTLELRIEGAHSLKDKRQVLRSLKDKLRAAFNISVAELEETDLWQRATLGIVSISGSRDYLAGLMQQVERAAWRIANDNGAEVADSFVEIE